MLFELNSIHHASDDLFQFLQMELESIRSQLLNDFCPDEMCPINAQFFEAPSKNPLSVSEDDFFHQEVYRCRKIYLILFSRSKVLENFKQAPLIDMGNETLAEVYETMPTSKGMSVPTTDLLGIDELLETVCSCSQNHRSPPFLLFCMASNKILVLSFFCLLHLSVLEE
jgi:hypothetical protein